MSTTTNKTFDNESSKPQSNSNNKNKKDSSDNEPIVSLREASIVDYDK